MGKFWIKAMKIVWGKIWRCKEKHIFIKISPNIAQTELCSRKNLSHVSYSKAEYILSKLADCNYLSIDLSHLLLGNKAILFISKSSNPTCLWHQYHIILYSIAVCYKEMLSQGDAPSGCSSGGWVYGRYKFYPESYLQSAII